MHIFLQLTVSGLSTGMVYALAGLFGKEIIERV